MSHRTPGPKALGLCFLAVLGLMAFTATAAQATGSFTFAGKASELTATTEGKTEGSAAFLVPSINLKIICEGATLKGQLEPKGHGKQEMTFSGCTTPSMPCTVDPIVANFLLSVVLHAEESWILFTPPEVGQPFTTIYLKGAECPFPEVNPLTGSFISLVGSESVEQLLTFSNDSATVKLFKELGINISYAFGARPAILEMSTVWHLTGAHSGMKWGAV